jgi:hypothetical protein
VGGQWGTMREVSGGGHAYPPGGAREPWGIGAVPVRQKIPHVSATKDAPRPLPGPRQRSRISKVRLSRISSGRRGSLSLEVTQAGSANHGNPISIVRAGARVRCSRSSLVFDSLITCHPSREARETSHTPALGPCNRPSRGQCQRFKAAAWVPALPTEW